MTKVNLTKNAISTLDRLLALSDEELFAKFNSHEEDEIGNLLVNAGVSEGRLQFASSIDDFTSIVDSEETGWDALTQMASTFSTLNLASSLDISLNLLDAALIPKSLFSESDWSKSLPLQISNSHSFQSFDLNGSITCSFADLIFDTKFDHLLEYNLKDYLVADEVHIVEPKSIHVSKVKGTDSVTVETDPECLLAA